MLAGPDEPNGIWFGPLAPYAINVDAVPIGMLAIDTWPLVMARAPKSTEILKFMPSGTVVPLPQDPPVQEQ